MILEVQAMVEKGAAKEKIGLRGPMPPEEYYASLQMGLPVLYYDGRENPPHPEIWIGYFLRMVEAYRQLDVSARKRLEEYMKMINGLG